MLAASMSLRTTSCALALWAQLRLAGTAAAAAAAAAEPALTSQRRKSRQSLSPKRVEMVVLAEEGFLLALAAAADRADTELRH